MVLGILPTGLHINLIHEAARHTVPFAKVEIIHQPMGEEDEEEEIGICFSRAGHFDKDQWSDTSVGNVFNLLNAKAHQSASILHPFVLSPELSILVIGL